METEDRPILSIEDSDEDYYSICQALKAAGIRNPVRRCADSRSAWASLDSDQGCLEARHAAFVLLDLNMPGVDGRDLLRRFRARDATVPVVILSTSAHVRDIESCYQAGANAYVVKPFDPGEWQRRLAAVAAFWLDTVVLPPPRTQ